MNTRFVTATLVGFAVVVGWNVFLIQRDQKLYDAYYGPQVTKANER
jgi:hypothetical protein